MRHRLLSRGMGRVGHAAFIAAACLSVGWSIPVAAQGPSASPSPGGASSTAAPSPPATDLPTERNVAFTLVEVEPAFFWTGPDLLDLRVTGMLMGRASVADLGDDHLMLVDVSDGDVITSQAAAIREVDRLADARGSTTWWGAISKQSRDLEVEPPADIGFVLARFDSREASLRESQVAAAEQELQSLEGAVLVARTIGSSDLLVLYDVDGSDLPGTLSDASAIRRALEGHELVIEVEGVGIPLGPG